MSDAEQLLKTLWTTVHKFHMGKKAKLYLSILSEYEIRLKKLPKSKIISGLKPRTKLWEHSCYREINT